MMSRLWQNGGRSHLWAWAAVLAPVVTVVLTATLWLPTQRGEAAGLTGPLTPEERERTQTILRYQQARFATMQSIEFAARFRVEPSEAERLLRQLRPWSRTGAQPHAATHDIDRSMRFASAGDKYLVDMRFSTPSTDQVRRRAWAWDGDTYSAVVEAASDTAFVSTDTPPEVPDFSFCPLLAQCDFLFILGAARQWRSIDGLRHWEPWSELLPLVTGYEEAAGDVEPGVTVAFQRADGLSTKVFFATNRGYAPWRWEVQHPDGWGSEYEVLATTQSPQSLKAFGLPLHAHLLSYGRPAAERSRDIYEIDARTLRVNEPIDQSVFRIPDSPDYYHEDPISGALMQPAIVVGKNTSFARDVIDGLYVGSLGGLHVRLDPAYDRANDDAIVTSAGEALRQRFGQVRDVQLAASETSPTNSVTTVWLITAEQGTLQMRTVLDPRGQLTGLSFRFGEDGGWVPLGDPLE